METRRDRTSCKIKRRVRYDLFLRLMNVVLDGSRPKSTLSLPNSYIPDRETGAGVKATADAIKEVERIAVNFMVK